MTRELFETWIAGPPFERDIERWPEDETNYGWPGCYKDMEVALAWVAYQEAIRMTLERLPRDELKRYLVCGGRDYSDWQFMRKKLKVLLEKDWMFILVHGDCKGADRLAVGWAKACELIVEAYPADWAKYGRAAGAIRNQEMLDSGIDGVIAFPGGKGTANMIKIAIQAGVPVWDLRDG